MMALVFTTPISRKTLMPEIQQENADARDDVEFARQRISARIAPAPAGVCEILQR